MLVLGVGSTGVRMDETIAMLPAEWRVALLCLGSTRACFRLSNVITSGELGAEYAILPSLRDRN